jgi:ribosomal protein L31E
MKLYLIRNRQSEIELIIHTQQRLSFLKAQLEHWQFFGAEKSSKQVRQMVNKNSAYDDVNIDTYLESEIYYQSHVNNL